MNSLSRLFSLCQLLARLFSLLLLALVVFVWLPFALLFVAVGLVAVVALLLVLPPALAPAVFFLAGSPGVFVALVGYEVRRLLGRKV